MIGVAAAEVAMKQYIATTVPDARWLVENLQSPPLDKMAKDYFPMLPRSHNDGIEIAIPNSILEELKKAVALRNTVAHKGEFSLNHKSLEAKLLAVRDLLWLLDYFAGHTWALAYVRLESLSGPPKPKADGGPPKSKGRKEHPSS